MPTYHATSFLLSFCSSLILTLVMPTYHATFFFLTLVIPIYNATSFLLSLCFLFITHPHPSNADLPRHFFSSLSAFSSSLILTLVMPTYHTTSFLLSFSSSLILTLVMPTYHACQFLSSLLLFITHPHPCNADLPRQFFSSLSLLSFHHSSSP